MEGESLYHVTERIVIIDITLSRLRAILARTATERDTVNQAYRIQQLKRAIDDGKAERGRMIAAAKRLTVSLAGSVIPAYSTIAESDKPTPPEKKKGG